jgi:hypothetical protein
VEGAGGEETSHGAGMTFFMEGDRYIQKKMGDDD